MLKTLIGSLWKSGGLKLGFLGKMGLFGILGIGIIIIIVLIILGIAAYFLFKRMQKK